MLEQQIYRKRFHSPENRSRLWKVLVESFFQQFVAPDDVVLDMPCGYGEFISFIACRKKLAVDINPDSVKFLPKDVKFFKSSAVKTPLKASSVDVVFISNFFEHITREQTTAVISELWRILRPGGRVMVLQPNIRFCARDYWMFFDHITPVDDRALTEAFALYGFGLEKNITRFLPYTTQSRIPQADILVKLYLRLPILWRVFGKQSFLVYKKESPRKQ
jgi:ubiquinone/menaquinone biosynthesis C-methylase UbiE